MQASRINIALGLGCLSIFLVGEPLARLLPIAGLAETSGPLQRMLVVSSLMLGLFLLPAAAYYQLLMRTRLHGWLRPTSASTAILAIGNLLSIFYLVVLLFIYWAALNGENIAFIWVMMNALLPHPAWILVAGILWMLLASFRPAYRDWSDAAGNRPGAGQVWRRDATD